MKVGLTKVTRPRTRPVGSDCKHAAQDIFEPGSSLMRGEDIAPRSPRLLMPSFVLIIYRSINEILLIVL